MGNIQVVISKDRKKARVEISGVKGGKCEEFAAPFEEFLGIQDGKTILKEEYYEKEEGQEVYEEESL